MGPACDDDDVPTTPQPKRQDYLRGSPDQIKGDCPKKIPADFPGRMLTPAQYAEIAKLRKMFRTRQGNPHGTAYREATSCEICSRQKHKVRREYRTDKKRPPKRFTTGSQCYACVRSMCQLKCGRSNRILKMAKGVLPVIRMRSAYISKHYLGANDICVCHTCEAERKASAAKAPPFRLRRKTQM